MHSMCMKKEKLVVFCGVSVKFCEIIHVIFFNKNHFCYSTMKKDAGFVISMNL